MLGIVSHIYIHFLLAYNQEETIGIMFYIVNQQHNFGWPKYTTQSILWILPVTLHWQSLPCIYRQSPIF